MYPKSKLCILNSEPHTSKSSAASGGWPGATPLSTLNHKPKSLSTLNHKLKNL